MDDFRQQVQQQQQQPQWEREVRLCTYGDGPAAARTFSRSGPLDPIPAAAAEPPVTGTAVQQAAAGLMRAKQLMQQGCVSRQRPPAVRVPLRRSTSSTSLQERVDALSDPAEREALLAELNCLLAALGMVSSGGASIKVSDLGRHTLSLVLLLRHLLSLCTHAVRLEVPHPRGKVFWEVEDLLGLAWGLVASALKTGEGLEDMLGAAARVLGVPYDPAIWGETLSDAYCNQPSVRLMLQETARHDPQLLQRGPLTRMSLLCHYLQRAPQGLHYSMVLAATHAPPTVRGAVVGNQFINMQYIPPVVNNAQGAFWEGALLWAMLLDRPGEFWAHCLDRMQSFLPLRPMNDLGRAAMQAQLDRLREQAKPRGAAAEQQQEAAAQEEEGQGAAQQQQPRQAAAQEGGQGRISTRTVSYVNAVKQQMAAAGRRV